MAFHFTWNAPFFFFFLEENVKSTLILQTPAYATKLVIYAKKFINIIAFLYLVPASRHFFGLQCSLIVYFHWFFRVNCKLYPKVWRWLDFIPWNFIRFYPLKFSDVWILHPNVSKFGFYSYILGVFGFYSLKFWNIWILRHKVLEFWDVKSKQS